MKKNIYTFDYYLTKKQKTWQEKTKDVAMAVVAAVKQSVKNISRFHAVEYVFKKIKTKMKRL